MKAVHTPWGDVRCKIQIQEVELSFFCMMSGFSFSNGVRSSVISWAPSRTPNLPPLMAQVEVVQEFD